MELEKLNIHLIDLRGMKTEVSSALKSMRWNIRGLVTYDISDPLNINPFTAGRPVKYSSILKPSSISKKKVIFSKLS